MHHIAAQRAAGAVTDGAGSVRDPGSRLPAMKTVATVVALLSLACPAAIAAAGDNARAVFAMICTREGLSLGHRDEALRRYVDGCVTAKMKVYDHDMSDPATAHIPKSC
jgi:hypothetical protein